MLDKTLSQSEKKYILEIIIDAGLSTDNFIWETRRNYFVTRSVLVYKPYLYYSIFEKNKHGFFVKDYFPNWAEMVEPEWQNTESIKKIILHWLSSIQRIFIRNKQIVATLDEGAERRKKYNDYAKAASNNSEFD